MTDAERREGAARELAGNAFLTGAFDLVEQAYIEAAKRCQPHDDVSRFRLITAADVVDTVRRHILATVQAGEITTAQTSELEDKPKRRFALF